MSSGQKAATSEEGYRTRDSGKAGIEGVKMNATVAETVEMGK